MDRSCLRLRHPAVLFGVAVWAAALLSPAGLRAVGPSGRPSTLGDLVDNVDIVNLEQIVRDLSGADTILVDGEPVVLRTRYALSDQKDLAFRYLFDRVAALGYQPEEQRFSLRVSIPDLMGCAVSASLDTVWVGSVSGTVYRTVLAGGWERFDRCAEMGTKIYDLRVDPAGRLWAACGLEGGNLGALFVSLDGGVSWELRKSGSTIYSLRSVAFSDEQFGVACGAAGTVLATADGGGYWYPLQAQAFRYLPLNGAASSGQMHFWICTDGGYLYETTNLGSPWTEHKLGTNNRLNAIDFADSLRGVLVGDGVAFYTDDGGASWSPTSVVPPPGPQPGLACVAMFDTLRVAAAGGGGMIFLSENGGADWTQLGACDGTDDVDALAFFARDRFFAAGRDEVRRIDIEPPGECRRYQLGDTTWGRNIIFRAEGRRDPDHRVVLCAHYDATTSLNPELCAPGADDNATGVSGVLESARILFGAPLARTVEFLLFDGEELGMRGSMFFAGRLDEDAVYESAVNLDMLGYDFRRDFSLKIAGRAAAQDSAIADTVMSVIDLLGLPLQPDYTTVSNLPSDHVSFQSFGVPAILLIESERNELNPTYHSCRDIADSVMFDYLTECVRAALGTVAVLAGYEFGRAAPAPVALRQNRPNPFPDGTLISFTAPAGLPVELSVYDVLGRLVARLDPYRPADADSGWASWDGRNSAGREIASGVYFVRLRAGGVSAVRKAVLIR